MIRSLTISLSLFALLFVSCKKEPIALSLTPHTEQKIIGEGFFTDSLQKVRFTFTLSNNLGSTDVIFADEVNLLVKTPDGPISFSKIEQGIYESDVPFKGIYGANYTIQFSYRGDVHQIVTAMPEPIVINDIYFGSRNSDSLLVGLGTVDLNVDSPVNQYLKFELSIAERFQLPEDTVWNVANMPVYRIVEIPAGDSVNVSLPISFTDQFYVENGDLIQLKTYIISQDVGEYLIKLRDYVTSELVNSQSYNPPYYYSNSAYGLGYGMIVDSLIYQY